MDSSAARMMWSRPVPRVSPSMAPRAYISQCGAPRPVKAGTTYTPPLPDTFRAKYSLSAASVIRCSSSRIHWITAPPTNTLPSRAYWTFPPVPAAMVVTRPFWLRTSFSPVFISKKQPVP